MKNDQAGHRPYRGRHPSARRVRFLKLIQPGITSLKACRKVACNERTGRDWAKGIVKSRNRRYTFEGVLVWETPDHPKLPPEQKVISSPFLSVEERLAIADPRRAGGGVRECRARASFPKKISRQVCRTSPRAASNKGIRRRTDVVGIFPDRDAVTRLVGPVLAEQHDESIEGRRKLGLDAPVLKTSLQPRPPSTPSYRSWSCSLTTRIRTL